MNNEAGERWYDAEIAPALLAIARKCEERGLSFLCTVEWAKSDGGRGSTMALSKDAGLAMRMTYMQMMSGENLDRHVFSIIKYARENNIDFGASIVYRKMTGEFDQ